MFPEFRTFVYASDLREVMKPEPNTAPEPNSRFAPSYLTFDIGEGINPMNADRFPYEGSWELLPELSIYQEGEAPRCGNYRITREGVTASFHIEWESADGKRGDVRFAGRCDG